MPHAKLPADWCKCPWCGWRPSVAEEYRLKMHVKFCELAPRPRGREFQKRTEGHMPGWAETKAKLPAGQPLLHGTDLPKGKGSIVVTIERIRQAPQGFNSPFIIDFVTPVFEKAAWAVNKTNGAKLAELFGDSWCDGENRLHGKKIRLIVALVNNPKTSTIGPSLFVEDKA